MKKPSRIWTGVAHAYVSVIGLALMVPLLRLLEDLEDLTSPPPNEVQAGNSENGLAAGVIILAVTMMESALNRTRYVRRDHPRKLGSTRYFLQVVRDAALADDLEEAITQRDSIIHNHIWKALVGAGPDRHLQFFSAPRLRKGYGDYKFGRVRKRGTRITRRLSLNLFPSRIDRRDARVVVKTVARCLRALESKKREYFPIQDTHLEFRGADMTFYEIVDSLPSLTR